MEEKADIRVQITVRRIQKLTIKIKSIAAMLCAIHFRKICTRVSHKLRPRC